ncbi:MAG: sulfite exporter TauE/SafE family protein [Pseudomonadales bacterium]|nr:sulfite exporter TauE/SafE family protein [Pseudomonadales bacterium]
MILVLILGALVGGVLGLTGAGGGILAVPALVFGLGWSVAQAAPTALLAVTASALFGAVEGHWRGLVRYRAATVIAIVGAGATPLGLRVAHVLPARWLLVLFALTMLGVAIRLLRHQWVRSAHKPLCRINAETGRLHWTPASALCLAGIGALTGFLTGLLGVGGGFVIVPALSRLTDMTMHGIVATSLMVITLVGSGAVLASVIHGHLLPLYVAMPFLAATAVGMILGRLSAHRFSHKHLQRLFAGVLVIVASSMFIRAL